MTKTKPDLLHGTLDLLILQTLAHEKMHGWAISKHIRQITDDVLEVNQGSWKDSSTKFGLRFPYS